MSTQESPFLLCFRNTSFLLRLLGVGLLGHLFLNFVLSLALARVSRWFFSSTANPLAYDWSDIFTIVPSLNYPGGEAINTLHSLKVKFGDTFVSQISSGSLHRVFQDSTSPVNVHLDVFTCQTGVSRFLQERWVFLNSCVKTGLSSSDMTGAIPKPRISPLRSCPASPTFWLRVPIDTHFTYGSTDALVRIQLL